MMAGDENQLKTRQMARERGAAAAFFTGVA
jgi:hypothetical protein